MNKTKIIIGTVTLLIFGFTYYKLSLKRNLSEMRADLTTEQSTTKNIKQNDPYAHINTGKVQYSEDGNTQYSSMIKKITPDKRGNDTRNIIIVNNKELEVPCWARCDLILSPNKNHFAYLGSSNPEMPFSDYLLVVDNQKILIPRLLADGKRENFIHNIAISNEGDFAYFLSEDLDYIQNKRLHKIILNNETIYSFQSDNAQQISIAIGAWPYSQFYVAKGKVFFTLENSKTNKSSIFINSENITGWVDKETLSIPIVDEALGEIFFIKYNKQANLIAIFQGANQIYSQKLSTKIDLVYLNLGDISLSIDKQNLIYKSDQSSDAISLKIKSIH